MKRQRIAEVQETAQWYIVNADMAEIRAIVGSKHGQGWSFLGEDIQGALRTELARIQAIGNACDPHYVAAESFDRQSLTITRKGSTRR